MMSKAAVGLAVGMAGIFVGYCFYFDKKRRSDPDFKKKLRERRKVKKAAQKVSSIPLNMKDQEVVQRFFLQEVQLGEELLASGQIGEGVEHLGNAVTVCSQPNELLRVLQETLPPEVFHRLLQELPIIQRKLTARSMMTEEDVE